MQNWSILAKFAKKNPRRNRLFFYWLFLGEVSPWNFPWNRPIFLRICPWKSFENWLFSAKIPRNGPIFLQILTFLPRKSPEISRFFCEFAPENPAKLCLFFREISEALYKRGLPSPSHKKKKYVKKIGGSLFSSFGSLWGLYFQDTQVCVPGIDIIIPR